MTKIYTRKGDLGKSSLVGGERRFKSDLRFHAYGTIDELMAWLTWIYETLPKDWKEMRLWMKSIEQGLWQLGGCLADPKEKYVRWDAHYLPELESMIDEVEAHLPLLKTFIRLGGSPLAAQFHIGRTICRRAERWMVQLNQEEDLDSALLAYVNRLSDLLFVLARYSNLRQGIADEPMS